MLTPYKFVIALFVTHCKTDISCKMISEYTKLSRYNLFKVEITILVGACQKCDIVDTFSHTSCAIWHIIYKKPNFPTVGKMNMYRWS
jgi:hypothetical protein